MKYFKPVRDCLFLPKFLLCMLIGTFAMILGILASIVTLGHFDFGEWMSDLFDAIDRIME